MHLNRNNIILVETIVYQYIMTIIKISFYCLITDQLMILITVLAAETLSALNLQNQIQNFAEVYITIVIQVLFIRIKEIFVI